MDNKDLGVAAGPEMSFLWATNAGDWYAEPGLGGGPIGMSLNVSGDTLSFSELSSGGGIWNPADLGAICPDLWASCTTRSASALDSATDFLFCGFWIGLCLTLFRAKVLGVAGFLRDGFLGCAVDSEFAPSPPISTSLLGSIGLGAAELAAVLGFV